MILRRSRPAKVVRLDRNGMGVCHGGWYRNVTAIKNNKNRLLTILTRLKSTYLHLKKYKIIMADPISSRIITPSIPI
jgi:hypothetical protein